MRIAFLLCFGFWLCVCGDGYAQPPNREIGDLKSQSRTINQRIVVQWIDDSQFTFAERAADGSITTRKVDANNGQITTLADRSAAQENGKLRGGPLPRSQSSATETSLKFINQTNKQVDLFWIDTGGNRKRYDSLRPGETHSQHTFAGHAWMVQSADGTFFGSMVAQSPPAVARIKRSFEFPKTPRNRSGRSRRFGNRNNANRSADGRFEFRLGDDGLQLRHLGDGESRWIDLQADDADGHEIVSPSWSPDGDVLAAWKVKRYQPADAVTIESSPSGGGRAKVKSRPYKLPGDASDEYTLIAFKASTGEPLDLDLPLIDFGRPRIRWFADHELTVEKIDRGHQRVRLFAVDPLSGSTRAVNDESSKTFIWTAHGPQAPMFTYLEKTDEVIYASECSGYRHLYRVDLTDGGQQNWRHQSITSGDWLVREIVRVDEEARTVDILVGEFFDDQDPYHRHLVRVGLDDQKLLALTASDGTHSIEYSPDGKFIVATHSRVDSPPVHELRRVSDGALVTELMRAERIGGSDSTGSPPRVFHAKGRDGETEIWGNLYFPADFDPTLKAHYPLIEAIYAGPHDSHVPKRYLHSTRFKELTALGFVVVQIDGMGTANRSKAFHDLCWHNLKDAGFPDRMKWIRAAAQQYPALDLSRVGIFGTSAGGQNACGAVLFHGDFYRAAYASCGCHDNRMDKASWNEQWMGYPVGQHYAENSNIENAGRLSSDLFLVVGELDTNVPPESTFRLVDALVKADKDFEFLMIPGMGHSDGGKYGKRKMREFFVEKLKP